MVVHDEGCTVEGQKSAQLGRSDCADLRILQISGHKGTVILHLT